jgi:hypothetical protein
LGSPWSPPFGAWASEELPPPPSSWEEGPGTAPSPHKVTGCAKVQLVWLLSFQLAFRASTLQGLFLYIEEDGGGKRKSEGSATWAAALPPAESPGCRPQIPGVEALWDE